MADVGLNRWIDLYLDDFLRLGRSDDPRPLLKKAEEVLSAESDADFLKALFLGVATILAVNGWEKESLAWSQRAVDNFPEDPVVQSNLAMRPLLNPLRDPTQGELDQALLINHQALEKARGGKCWRRYVLSDRCRIAAVAGRYDVVAEAMADILEAWGNSSEPDTPVLEDDWLDNIPDGVLDKSLLEQYQALASQKPSPS